MNIQHISNFIPKYVMNNNQKENLTSTTNFGLKMPAPLAQDSVNFTSKVKRHTKAAQRIRARFYEESKLPKGKSGVKTMIDIPFMPNIALKAIQDFYKESDEVFSKKLHKIFEQLEKEGKITIESGKLKEAYSIGEKAKSSDVQATTKEDAIARIDDISRARIIVNSPDAFEEVVENFSRFLKRGMKYKVTDFENFRMPKPNGEGGFDSFRSQIISDLKRIVKNDMLKECGDKDSSIGYSGIHITLTEDGIHKHELQIITKGMHKVKVPEDLLYKIKSGKALNPIYKSTIGPLLAPLRPTIDAKVILEDGKISIRKIYADSKNTGVPLLLTDEEKQIRAKVFKYSKDAYAYALEHPYDDVEPLTAPSSIASFDFSYLTKLMADCKRKAEIKKLQKTLQQMEKRSFSA